MDRRLPPRNGEWIDRSRPVEFRFEGATYRGFAGDVLSSALWASDVRLLGRSFKYHRPRGIYSLAGHDANVMVEDGQRTNLRGDLLRIAAGLDVRSVNTIGGLERDRLSITEKFARFLPVGFYYKAFHTPRRLFPFYENQMRKVAGLGKINPTNEPPCSPKNYAFFDLLVVGSGPAGLAAAIAAAEQGLQVLMVDEQPRPGGSLGWQWARDAVAGQHLEGLLEQVAAMDNIQLRCGTQAAGWYGDHWIALVDDKRLTKLRAKSMLVAAGCFEQPAVFQNNDLPGVMLGSAAQRLIHLYAVKPFDRAVVLAANCDGYRVALDLHDAGVEVAAIVDLRHDGEPTKLGRDVEDAGIAVHRGYCVYEAVPAAGKKRIRAATICPLDRDGTPRTGSLTRIDCDGIAMSVGWSPNGGLIYQGGGRFRHDERVEQLVPQSLPAGLFAAGRANGVFDLEQQIDDGYRAGLAAASHLGRFNGEVPDQLIHQAEPPSHSYPIIPHRGKKNFVDLDEDLHLVDFSNSHQEGYDNIELMKRFSTVGMGPSQGKLSNINAVRILAKLNGASINETGTTTSRPFHQPVSIGHLAGRRFHPQRRTPIDDWHRKASAEMMHAGDWSRPEYYRIEGRSREECIFEEAKNVRENIGLIDVSTLGKLWINGPDAVRFLERIYTGRFAKQQVGRVRYGLACDETGVIIEDGVVARVAENRFYVTATSSGAGAFYREMQRWAMIWSMNVTLVNATGHLAAINIAGPNCREVLRVLTDVDLSADAFPYLGLRQGTVAGAPATLMRVGFVGELGYEIHVPASFTHHLWTSLMQAGSQFGIRAFGVEAQRLLRLEKGHLIIGQDTDALTTPFEADVAWAIGKNKSFFVGSRSLDIMCRKPLTRRLVGLVFRAGQINSLPEECHLIIANGEIAGRITSIAPRSTLGHAIAMALVRPDLADVGTIVKIRIDNGTLIEATVTSMPFYDPENTRQ
ncbi:MAG: 2Fe-2S iron-sulfur cluster-binding protein [Planctomycetota bacterium]|nr:2Fe-2S iron-sulfur cluster-binding protein [Planctomycetota bacterium]